MLKLSWSLHLPDGTWCKMCKSWPVSEELHCSTVDINRQPFMHQGLWRHFESLGEHCTNWWQTTKPLLNSGWSLFNVLPKSLSLGLCLRLWPLTSYNLQNMHVYSILVLGFYWLLEESLYLSTFQIITKTKSWLNNYLSMKRQFRENGIWKLHILVIS